MGILAYKLKFSRDNLRFFFNLCVWVTNDISQIAYQEEGFLAHGKFCSPRYDLDKFID